MQRSGPPRWLRMVAGLPDHMATEEAAMEASTDSRFDLARLLALHNDNSAAAPQAAAATASNDGLQDDSNRTTARDFGSGEISQNERDSLLKYLQNRDGSNGLLAPPVAEAVPLNDVEECFHSFQVLAEVNPSKLLSEAQEELDEALLIVAFGLGKTAAQKLRDEIVEAPELHLHDERPGIRMTARASLRVKYFINLTNQGTKGWGGAGEDVDVAGSNGCVTHGGGGGIEDNEDNRETSTR